MEQLGGKDLLVLFLRDTVVRREVLSYNGALDRTPSPHVGPAVKPSMVLLFRRRCVIEDNSPAFCQMLEHKCKPTVRLVVCAPQPPLP